MSGYEKIFKELDEWITSRNYIGIDPYDIRGHPTLIKMQSYAALKKIAYFAPDFMPNVLIKTLGIKGTENSKALALMITAYSNMHKGKNDEKLKSLIERLEKQQDKKTCGWGYPFDWQSKKFTPKGTPSGVVTSFVVHSLVQANSILKDKTTERLIKSSARLFEELNEKEFNDGIMLSYTPIDNNFVYNANILSAYSLIQISKFKKDKKLKEKAEKMITAFIKGQKEDGSWAYGTTRARVDPVHTAFNIEFLYRVDNKNKQIRNSIEKGLEYYKKNLIQENAIPKRSKKKTPVDIHACATGITMAATIGEKELATNILDWTIKNMRNKDGTFQYRKYPLIKNKYPFMRWGQVWMARAISEYLYQFGGKSE